MPITKRMNKQWMIAAVAVAFFLFCFFFLSLWKAGDLWKTSISVRLGWSDGSLLWHSLQAVCDRAARPGLATNIFPYLSKVNARFSSEAAAGDYDAYSDDVSGRLTIRITLFPARQAESIE